MYRLIYRNFATCSTAVEPYRAGEKALPLGEAFAHGQASLRTTSQSASQTAPLVGEPLAKRGSFPVCQGLPSIGATATTAASGGNREELLGQRPAGCKRQRSRRWVPQPGQWHAAGVTERFFRGQAQKAPRACAPRGKSFLSGKGCVKQGLHQLHFQIVTIVAYFFPFFWNVPAYSSTPSLL